MRTGRTALPAILIATPAGGPALGDEATGPPPHKTFREAFRTFVRNGRYLVTFPSRARARDGRPGHSRTSTANTRRSRSAQA